MVLFTLASGPQAIHCRLR
uniref:Uncharacterized protein n=1 Tax=Arundo donax TaxID=35708 RepID=A0A0A9G688_ARUDO